LGSFRLTGAIHVEESKIQLPRIGKVSLKEKGYLPSTLPNNTFLHSEVQQDRFCNVPNFKINSATISECAGRWFVSLSVEQEISLEAGKGEPIGVDFGLKKMAVSSDSTYYENPKALRKRLRKLARAQRKMSRQKKGSTRREITRLQIARLHFRISNIRKDAIHKATSSIVAKSKPLLLRPSACVIEDLNVAGMLKNRQLSRAIADVSFGDIRRQLKYKCLWNGIELIVADRFFASSKTCSACDAVKSELLLSEREYVCESCGIIIDRDLNAAKNLQKLAGSSSESINVRGGDVRLR